MIGESNRPDKGAATANLDIREALFNGGDIGPIQRVQVSTERITEGRGILFDFDPDLHVASAILKTVPDTPHEFYSAVVRPWCDRNEVLKLAEIRTSGRGIHAILWFDEPLKFHSDHDRDRWANIIKVIQAVVPVDPDMPGITATTRAVGSINSKSGTKVSVLKEGNPVSKESVLGLFDLMCAAPFKTVFQVLIGNDRIEPCPICEKSGSELKALDHAGRCYGSCGTVKLDQLYDLVLKPRTDGKEAKKDGDGR